MKETLFSEAQTFALPDKSEILRLAENIGDTVIPPTPDELQRAMGMLLELGDECYRQREEIARLMAENAKLSGRLKKIVDIARQANERQQRLYDNHNIGYCGERKLVYSLDILEAALEGE